MMDCANAPSVDDGVTGLKLAEVPRLLYKLFQGLIVCVEGMPVLLVCVYFQATSGYAENALIQKRQNAKLLPFSQMSFLTLGR